MILHGQGGDFLLDLDSSIGVPIVAECLQRRHVPGCYFRCQVGAVFENRTVENVHREVDDIGLGHASVALERNALNFYHTKGNRSEYFKSI